MSSRFDHWQRDSLLRRVALFGVAALQTWIATRYLLKTLPNHGETPLEFIIAVLFAILFGWISLGFWTAMAGFFVTLFPGLGRRFSITSVLQESGDEATIPLARTAIVIPICNEDAARVFAGLRATYNSLRETGHIEHFDFFVLSDSNDPDNWVEEEHAWARWCRESGDFKRIHYRLRRTRIKRKTGNIADFCRRWGSQYRYMIVFDADSIMTGTSLVKMVRIMEKRRQIGILQTAPQTVNRESLYARSQQFGNHVYGPLFAAGLNFWQMGDGYYWGHNAIIRLAPFIEHCNLERLPGKAPMGGEILSHDFVEAAYIRRAGWEVWLAFDLEGSYEESPPTLLDELKRDRRWSQGNLQHLRLISGWGIKTTHRIMFLYGMMAYGSALLWLTLLGVSTAEVALRVRTPPEYFPERFTLFPSWPAAWFPEWVIGLLVATATLLFLPKILGIVYIAIRRLHARYYGGVLGLSVSVFFEALLSALLAPVRMLFHSRYVMMTLLGRDVRWGTQTREDVQTRWRDALVHHGFGLLLALLWAAYIYYLDPDFLLWTSPIIVALVFAPAVSVITSKRSLGLLAHKLRLFRIPAETQRDPLLRDLDHILANEDALRQQSATGFAKAVIDPVVNALHLSLLPKDKHYPPETKAELVALRERAYTDGPEGLSPREKFRLLADPDSIGWLHQRLWRAHEPEILTAWQFQHHTQRHEPATATF
ncbi:MAG: glucans biosynthesis glucosyltransferase MdoH [Thiotrichales bacterium]